MVSKLKYRKEGGRCSYLYGSVVKMMLATGRMTMTPALFRKYFGPGDLICEKAVGALIGTRPATMAALRHQEKYRAKVPLRVIHISGQKGITYLQEDVQAVLEVQKAHPGIKYTEIKGVLENVATKS